jgi:pimeloyl-ACP methyl ester carboxylesterase
MALIETTAGSIWIEDNRHDTSSVVTLMLHGAGGSHLHFPPEVRHLPQANAIIPDLSGHASSTNAAGSTISDYAADMLALLDALHIDTAIVAGHSMGGAIALHMALTYPQRVCGLILIATGAKLSVHPDILNGVLTDFPQTASALMDWQWHPDTPAELRDTIGYTPLIATPASTKYSEYLHQHIVGSKLVLIDNGAHMLTHEQPHLIAATLREWLLANDF